MLDLLILLTIVQLVGLVVIGVLLLQVQGLLRASIASAGEVVRVMAQLQRRHDASTIVSLPRYRASSASYN